MVSSLFQSAKAVVMVRPARFGFNPETLATNDYQTETDRDEDDIHREAIVEFEGLKAALVHEGVAVHEFVNDDSYAVDAIVPNASSAHPEGVCLYPLLTPSRQRERSPAFVDFLTQDLGYALWHDFSGYEAQDKALEATASLVMDRVNQIAYSALSPRTDEALAREACEKMGYELVLFETEDHVGKPIYHTDVMMFIGTGYAGICLDCITHGRDAVEASLSKTHEIIALTPDQLLSMCGNALEVSGAGGKRFLVMSDAALEALSYQQRDRIESYEAGIIHADLRTIEKYGGGSARCMLLDLH